MGYVRDDLKAYRHEAICAARGLHYGEDVISAIRKAKTVNEIRNVMTTARHKFCDAEIGMSVEAYDRLIDRERP